MKNLLLLFGLLMMQVNVKGQSVSAESKIAKLAGIYKHNLPCSHCTGVENTLTLYCKAPCKSGNYSLKEAYVNSINGDHISETTGRWSVTDTSAGLDESGVVLGLVDNNKPGKTEYYLVLNEGNLEQLDKNKNQIPHPFNLLLKKQ